MTNLVVVIGQRVKHCFSSNARRPFANFFGPVTFLGLEAISDPLGLEAISKLYRSRSYIEAISDPLGLEAISDPLVEQLGWSLRDIRPKEFGCLARIESNKLVLLDFGNVVDNVVPSRKKGLYDSVNFFDRYLILFFWYLLRVKIRCDRKSLDLITFEKMWVHAASLVVRNGATLESSFPVHDSGIGLSGPKPSEIVFRYTFFPI